MTLFPEHCGRCSVFVSPPFRDDEEKKKPASEGADEKANGTHPRTAGRVGGSTNPFVGIPHDPDAAVYKSGFLARKIHADMDGKKSKCHLLSFSILFISPLGSEFKVNLSEVKSRMKKNYVYPEKSTEV